jgi:hypothetical protein
MALATGCAHAGAGSEADTEAAIAAGVRAAVRLYLTPEEALAAPICVEVTSSTELESGVVAALRNKGTRAVAMSDCFRPGTDAVLQVRVLSYDWVDWVTHGKLDMRGTVETRPEERANFRLSWWRATFHASLSFYQGEWAAAADDLGRI